MSVNVIYIDNTRIKSVSPDTVLKIANGSAFYAGLGYSRTDVFELNYNTNTKNNWLTFAFYKRFPLKDRDDQIGELI